MSTETKQKRQRRTVGTDPTPAPQPAVTEYQKIVAQAVEAISAALNQIPGYQDDLSTVVRHRLRRSVSAEFIDMTASMIEASSDLQAMTEIGRDDCRDTTQYVQALRPLAELLNGSADRIELLTQVREVNTGVNARRYYAVAKSLIRNTDNTHLIPHVEALRDELRRTRGTRTRHKTPQPAPQPPATPAEKGGVAA